MTEQEKAKEIVALVARQFSLTPEVMCGRSRMERLAWPRQIAMALIAEFTELPLREVAACVGRTDHGTVIHARGIVDDREATIPRTHHLMAELRGQIMRPASAPMSTEGDW